MILLSTIIKTFEAEFLADYQNALLPSQRQALAAMKQCRTSHSPVMLAQCDDCNGQLFVPHSCGHRNCPHCQQHESQQWLERQLQRQVPAEYFLLTFTLPEELRALAWQQQRLLYDLMIRCSWETVKTFAQNDPQLKGNAGAITVLHTHSRRLDYHPHVHCVIPAAAIDADKRLLRAPAFFAKAEMGSIRFQQRKICWRLWPPAAPIRPASVPLRHIFVYSMRLRSTSTNGLTPCRDALYFAYACPTRADSGKTPGATAIGD